MMNKKIVRAGILLTILLLVRCTTAWKSLDGVVLSKPSSGCKLLSFSPQLDRVLYKCDGGWWLASLPGQDDAIPIKTTDSASETWSEPEWTPDGKTFLVMSSDLAKDTNEWWLVKVDDLDDRTHLCTLPRAARLTMVSPAGTALVTVDTLGSVTLIHADGSGCEELPISGRAMRTPSFSWSLNGEKIAYIHIPSSGRLDAAEMRVIDLSTRRVTTAYADGTGLPQWFPDGEEVILFGRGNVLPVVRADGSGLVGEIEIPEDYDVVWSTGNAWSPDGSRLALYLDAKSSNHETVAIGILDRDTLVISVFEVPHFFSILVGHLSRL